MSGEQLGTSCTNLFKQLWILYSLYQYVHSLINFTAKNQENIHRSLSMHNISTSNKHHIHSPDANLLCFQGRKFNAYIRIFNNLPCSWTNLENEKARFYVELRKYLNKHPFTVQMCKYDP